MELHVVSSSRVVKTAFETIDKGRSFELHWHGTDAAVLSTLSGSDSFLYLDASGLDQRSLRRKLTQLERSLPHRYGILDPKGEITDPAELFHRSAADYMGKALLRTSLPAARIRRALAYRPSTESQGETTAIESLSALPSGRSWDGVTRGEKYTFLMVYAGIDRVADLRRKLSEEFLTGMRKSFVALVQHYLNPYGARVWMWKEDDGLLLLPYNGESIESVRSILLLRLNWPVHQTTNPRQFSVFGWRLALHLGVTTYETGGNTGSIVSDDVNFAFHLGTRFVKSDSVACTDAVYQRLSPAAQSLFVPQGTFEDRAVHRLKSLM